MTIAAAAAAPMGAVAFGIVAGRATSTTDGIQARCHEMYDFAFERVVTGG